LPEVIGNTDALFDISSKEDIALKISSVLTNDSLHESLRHKGLVQSKKFNWDQSAKIAISAIENYIENNNNHCNRLPSTQILVNKIAEVIPADLSEKNLLNIASIIGQNHPQCGLKQLFIDVSELSQRDAATGVQRVTRSILTQFLNNPPVGFRVEPVYATTQNSGYYYARKYTAKLQGQSGTTDLDEPLMPMAGDIFFGLDLQHHVVIKQADYFKQLKRQNVSLYFVVYDLLPITFSKYFPEEHSTLHAKWLEVISKFDGLSCISATVAEELDEWLGINFPDRKSKLNITYFNLGADIENSVPSKGLTRDYIHVQSLLKNSFNFLVVGTLEPRKGQEQVLLAFEELWAKGVDANLVLVGKQGWMVDDLIEKIQNHSKLGIKLFWLNGISDEYLEKIYSESTCLIAASEGEGFGLPLIEAAQHELPVIARDIPVFREVAGGHAYYFKGEEPTGLAHYIEEWIILYREQKHPTSNNMPWISWKQSADIIISNIFGCEKICPVKQLFLDISELVQHDAKSGIQRVVRSLLKELLINPPEGFRVEPVYATIDHGYRYANKFTTKFLNRSEFALNDELIEYRAGDIFLGLDLQPQVVTVHQSFYQKIRRHGVQVQFIVHDLLPVTNPDWFCEGADKGYSQWLKIITQSDGAICVSKVTANELQAWINKNNVSTTRPFRITVSHNGADIENSSPSKGMPENCNEVLITLNKYPSFLMVGTIEPRKAYAQTLAAFENLWDKNIEINLVIVGKEGWMVEAVIEKLNKHPELGKHLFWLKGISDEYLEKIYGASTCLIAASEGEGFGLPLIEAAQHKLPIIARDIPVYREVAGNQAYYFNGKTPNQLADSVEDWIRLNEQIMVPDSSCMRFLTWKVSAQQLIKNLLSNREGEES
jgi:glycosyltransferase involved in cell wall biosynthesis